MPHAPAPTPATRSSTRTFAGAAPPARGTTPRAGGLGGAPPAATPALTCGARGRGAAWPNALPTHTAASSLAAGTLQPLTRTAPFPRSNDAAACTANPNCKAAPRCARASCEEGDSCCLVHDMDTCRSTRGCNAGGYCSLAYSPCWEQRSASGCNSTAGCSWQYGDGYSSTASGWCQTSSDPCSAQSLLTCNSVFNTTSRQQLCRWQVSGCSLRCCGPGGARAVSLAPALAARCLPPLHTRLTPPPGSIPRRTGLLLRRLQELHPVHQRRRRDHGYSAGGAGQRHLALLCCPARGLHLGGRRLLDLLECGHRG